MWKGFGNVIEARFPSIYYWYYIISGLIKQFGLVSGVVGYGVPQNPASLRKLLPVALPL